jgi:hypothetical protein
MTALTTALIILLSISIWYFSALPRNYILALNTGLPPYLSPVSPLVPLTTPLLASFNISLVSISGVGLDVFDVL